MPIQDDFNFPIRIRNICNTLLLGPSERNRINQLLQTCDVNLPINHQGDRLLHLVAANLTRGAISEAELIGIEVLIKYGADMRFPNADGHTPFSILLDKSRTYFTFSSSTVEMFLKAGACVNDQDKLGNTFLHIVLANKRDDLIPLLCKNGLALSLENILPVLRNNVNVSDKAIQTLFASLIKYHDINKVLDEDGNTVLHFIAKYRPNIQWELVKLGANPYKQNNQNEEAANKNGLAEVQKKCKQQSLTLFQSYIVKRQMQKLNDMRNDKTSIVNCNL